MSLFNASRCATTSPGIVVAFNDTASRVCGLTTTNTSALGSCCGQSGDGQVHEYYCSHYCNTGLSIQDFVGCLIEEGSETESSIVQANAFCQNGIASNTTARLDSFGISRARPRHGYLFWILTIGFLSAGQVLGAIVPSLSSAVLRRQSSTCSMQIESNYTTIRATRPVSGQFGCQETTICFQNIPVDTGLLNNNRTFNETSAAEPKYDMFFDMLQNKTGRMFPALSSVELNLDFVVNSPAFSVGFTPLEWCVNGTVSSCADLVGTDDAVHINACGPVFVSDYASPGSQAANGDAIQGIILPISM